jgi:uncharacterized protein (TIGR02147 family)
MRLGASEAAYFDDLVRFQKADRDPRLKALLLERLRARHPSSEFRVLDHETFQAISGWHFYAIRELTRLGDFREDPRWIRRRLSFRVSSREIRDAITVLLRLGLLGRDQAGRLCPSRERVTTRSDIADEGLKRFHEQMLTHAYSSIRAVDPAQREISGTTFPLRRDSLDQAKELIRKFQTDLCELLSQDGGDEVYQLEVAFFPLSRTKRGKS